MFIGIYCLQVLTSSISALLIFNLMLSSFFVIDFTMSTSYISASVVCELKKYLLAECDTNLHAFPARYSPQRSQSTKCSESSECSDVTHSHSFRSKTYQRYLQKIGKTYTVHENPDTAHHYLQKTVLENQVSATHSAEESSQRKQTTTIFYS